MRYFVDYEMFDNPPPQQVDVFYGCGNMKCSCGSCSKPIGVLDTKKALDYIKENSNFEFDKFIEKEVKWNIT